MKRASTGGERLAQAACAFIGTPFRLHGRDPATGLDCVGLLCASLASIGIQAAIPEGYRLRNTDPERWFRFAYRSGLADAPGCVRAGDVVLIEPSAGQQHLLIAETRVQAIHAHAGLRRIVRQRLDFPANRLAHWRLTPDI